jgi:glycosyltransferase involved in cell wall biosynthesis
VGALALSDALRIAMVAACPFPSPRGTPVRIRRLAEALCRRGHDVHVVTYHLGEPLDAPPFRLHRIRDFCLYRRTSAGPTYRKLFLLDPLLARALRKCLSRCNIDLIHAHHYEGLIAARMASRRPGCPLVYDAHTILETELPHYRIGLPGGFKRRLGRLLDRKLPALADHTIAVTDAVRERLLLAGAVADSAVTVVMNGVEADAFDVPAGTRWRGAPGTRTVIFTGNLAPYQGIPILLEAFARIRERCADARLLIVTGSSFDPYEKLSRDLGIREAVILRDDPFEGIPSLLAGADVAVSPRADGEGVPQKILNYMAAGKAIVAFAGSAGPIEDGRTGLCAEKGSPGALASAVLRLLDDGDLARRLGEAARARARDELSWDAAAVRVEEVYRQLLARGRAGR